MCVCVRARAHVSGVWCAWCVSGCVCVWGGGGGGGGGVCVRKRVCVCARVRGCVNVCKTE